MQGDDTNHDKKASAVFPGCQAASGLYAIKGEVSSIVVLTLSIPSKNTTDVMDASLFMMQSLVIP
jgi:hypothetical protein